MQLKTFTVGSFFTNCYVIWCDSSKQAIVVDPGFDRESEVKSFQNFLQNNDFEIKYIVDTHGHPDHTSGNGIVKGLTGAPILIHELDAHMLSEKGRDLALAFGIQRFSPAAEKYLDNDDVVKFGDVHLKVLHTPGHSPGSICLVGETCVFTGDTLFAGSIGRVDLPGGSGRDIMISLRKKLIKLPDDFHVFPGHGPKSKIGDEKKYNPFLRTEDSLLL